MKPVTQEHPSGCAVACVASLLGVSYNSALKLFDNPKYAKTRGYYCREICRALGKKKIKYDFKRFKEKHKHFLNKEGTIVYTERNSEYPLGHYLLRTKKGWMNPWINFPSIVPAKSGFSKKLPGKPKWIVYRK